MSGAAEPDEITDPGDRRAQLELLLEENRRLRAAYGRIHRTRHRRTALGLAAIGVAGVAGAALFPDTRVVLVVLGATGLFAGLLTWYLTPERFVAADVGERVYAALAENESAAAAELGLADSGVYLPTPDDPDRDVVLYVPPAGSSSLPDTDALDTVFVVGDSPDGQGLALRPTGDPLLAELETATPGGLPDEPIALVDVLVDGLREQFELADGLDPEVDPDDHRVSIGVTDSAFGPLDRFDHPVPSLIATGLAAGLDAPVRLAVDHTPEARSDYLVTARWGPVE